VDVLGYNGKRVIVTGAAAGIGAAAARLLVDLGAEVHAVDVRKPDMTGLASFSECDLRDPAQIEATVERVGRVVNMLFNCAHVPDPSPPLDVVLVTFCGLRQLTELVVAKMLDHAGCAIASVASTTEIRWTADAQLIGSLLATTGFDAAKRWCEAHPVALAHAHGLSKHAITGYTETRACSLATAGIRLNCVDTGPTDALEDPSEVPFGRRAVAEEQAWPLVFLNSPRASYVTGATLEVDGGFAAALRRGHLDPPALAPRRS
jgi:NAD(P)-dependent dehydrogenase (short-subunit alcohol dehydrogenase family)